MATSRAADAEGAGCAAAAFARDAFSSAMIA
jgi:hypothetical protein